MAEKKATVEALARQIARLQLELEKAVQREAGGDADNGPAPVVTVPVQSEATGRVEKRVDFSTQAMRLEESEV